MIHIMDRHSLQLFEAVELPIECLDENVVQLMVRRSNGRKSKAKAGAKAEPRAFQDRALNIVEQVLPRIGDCCVEFCMTGSGQINVILHFVEALVRT